MKLYRAETGQNIPWRASNNDRIRSLDDFKQELERSTGVPIDCQVILTSFGEQVKADQVVDILTATGRNEYIIFLYDKQHLGATEEEILTLLDVEMPSLEPRILPFDVPASLNTLSRANESRKGNLSQTCELYLQLFSDFDTFSQVLARTTATHAQLAKLVVEELKAQSMALNVAIANLESLNQSLCLRMQGFCERAERELAKHALLMEALDMDLGVLRDTRINAAVSDSISGDAGSRKERLIDFLDAEHTEAVKMETWNLCEHLAKEIKELQSLSSSLQQAEGTLQKQASQDLDLPSCDTLVADVQDLQNKTKFLRDKIKRDLGRIYSRISTLLGVPIPVNTSQTIHSRSPSRSNFEHIVRSGSPVPHALTSHSEYTLEAFNHLVDVHINDYLPKLTMYENGIREKVTHLVWTKRGNIKRFLNTMNEISHLQSKTYDIYPRLEKAERNLIDIQQEQRRRDLEAAQGIIFAYGSLLVESARRKEYSLILTESADAIADLLAGFRDEEQRRREQFLHQVSQLLPFSLQNMDNSTPHCEVSIVNMHGKGLNISRKDVDEYARLLGMYYAPAEQKPKKLQVPFRKTHQRDWSTLHSPNLSLKMSQRLSFKTNPVDLRRAKFMDLLNTMKSQLDGLKSDFLKALESSFFPVANDYRFQNRSVRRIEGSIESGSPSSLFGPGGTDQQRNSRALSIAEEKIKAYERRIASLERTLQQNFKSSFLNSSAQEQIRQADGFQSSSRAESTGSSTYSVVENENAKPKSEDLQDKLDMAERKLEALHQDHMQALDKISELNETISKYESDKNNLAIELEHYKDHNEQEKEDLRLQIQELEQLLEDERQAYEENRKSFLKEAQIKDNLADIRVADVEEEWKKKMKELQQQLDDQRKDNERLRKEHESEIALLKRKNEETIEQLVEQFQKEQESKETAIQSLKQKLFQSEEKLATMTEDVKKSEKTLEEVQKVHSQTKEMVARAERDWMEKHQAWESVMDEKERIDQTLRDISLHIPSLGEHFANEMNTIDMLHVLGQYIKGANIELDMAQRDLEKSRQDCTELTKKADVLRGEKAELTSLGLQIAEKLEEFRKDLVYEITNHLQLPVGEMEAGEMTRKIQLSNGQDIMAWKQVLQAASAVDIPRFVHQIRKRLKEALELVRKSQQDYKELREKYHKVSGSAFEKIAFRNFKIGDVALFLPTRNSNGKPWAAFNINAPHYFLKPSESVLQQMDTREWIVARIVSITEHTVNSQDPQSNPYGLSEGLTYYQLEVEHWKKSRYRKSHKSQHRHQERTSTHRHGHEEENVPQNMDLSASQIQSTYSLSTMADTGLASITVDTRPDASSSMTPTPTSPTFAQVRRSHFPLSGSTSNIVHSYLSPSSPPTSAERRSSIGYFNRNPIQSSAGDERSSHAARKSFSAESALDPIHAWTAQE